MVRRVDYHPTFNCLLGVSHFFPPHNGLLKKEKSKEQWDGFLIGFWVKCAYGQISPLVFDLPTFFFLILVGAAFISVCLNSVF